MSKKTVEYRIPDNYVPRTELWNYAGSGALVALGLIFVVLMSWQIVWRDRIAEVGGWLDTAHAKHQQTEDARTWDNDAASVKATGWRTLRVERLVKRDVQTTPAERSVEALIRMSGVEQVFYGEGYSTRLALEVDANEADFLTAANKLLEASNAIKAVMPPPVVETGDVVRQIPSDWTSSYVLPMDVPPAKCSTGDVYPRNATSGTVVFICTQKNTWIPVVR